MEVRSSLRALATGLLFTIVGVTPDRAAAISPSTCAMLAQAGVCQNGQYRIAHQGLSDQEIARGETRCCECAGGSFEECSGELEPDDGEANLEGGGFSSSGSSSSSSSSGSTGGSEGSSCPGTAQEGFDACCIDMRTPDRVLGSIESKDFHCNFLGTSSIYLRFNSHESFHFVAKGPDQPDETGDQATQFSFFSLADMSLLGEPGYPPLEHPALLPHPDSSAAHPALRSDAEMTAPYQLSFTYPTRSIGNIGDKALKNDVWYRIQMAANKPLVSGTLLAKKASSTNSLHLNLFNVGSYWQRARVNGILPNVISQVRNSFQTLGIQLTISISDKPSPADNDFFALPDPGEEEAPRPGAQNRNYYLDNWQPGAVNGYIGWARNGEEESWGVSGGVPGSAVRSRWSAIVVYAHVLAGADQLFSQDEIDSFARTLTHELSHYLGLFHTTTHDLPEAGLPMRIIFDGCDNIMYPYAFCSPGNTLQTLQNSFFHSAQGAVMKFHPLVK